MRSLFLAMTLLCIPYPGVALQSPLKTDSPESYTVQKGDTLWGVAEHFLESPWRWPEIWHSNPQIKNPHLIFPGDVVSLVYIDGKPKLTVSRRGETGRTIKLSPKIRTTPIEQAIPAIPLRLVDAFIRSSRIFSIREELSRAPHVFSSNSKKIAASTGDVIYARGRFPDSDGRYEIFRKGKKLKDPRTGEVFGIIGHKAADASLSSFADGIGVLKVTDAKMHVMVGDRILEKDTFTPVTTFFPQAPVEPVTGKILGVLHGGRAIGQYDTIIVNLGARESLRQGDILVVQTTSKVKDPVKGDRVRLPPKDVGMVMIYRPFDKLSYGIVMSAIEDLKVGDYLSAP